MQLKDGAHTQVVCVDTFTRITLTYIYKQVPYRILFLGFLCFLVFMFEFVLLLLFSSRGEGWVCLFSSNNAK